MRPNTVDRITRNKRMGLMHDRKKAVDVDVLSVLIADDDTPTRILLRAAISQWGYEVIEAKDGEEAWDVMQQSNAPRLLIIDWLMPKLNGVELCERIKSELTQAAYIILLTQQAGTTNIIKGLEAGADEFLSKPFNMAELRSRLSIGARIIRYQNAIAEQNRQLQKYISQIEASVTMAMGAIEQLHSSISTPIGNPPSTSSVANLARIQEVSASLDNIIKVIKQYRSENSSRN